MLTAEQYINTWLDSHVVWNHILMVVGQGTHYSTVESALSNWDWETEEGQSKGLIKFRLALKPMISGVMVNPDTAKSYSLKSSYFYVDTDLVCRWFRWDLVQYKSENELPEIFSTSEELDDLFARICVEAIQKARESSKLGELN